MISPRISPRSYAGSHTPTAGATVQGEDDAEDLAQEFKVIREGLEHPQITAKSLLVGTIVGSFVAVLGMYYALKIGVVPSLNVLAGVGGFVLTKALMPLFGGVFTVQENVVFKRVRLPA
jgi:hypothetical protein